MKHLLLIALLFTTGAWADAPSVSCPAGYVAVEEQYITIENGSCPSGTTSVGTAETCLVSSPTGSCMMYAPSTTAYSDSVGNYEFTEICPLT